jgi:hypothetical protein
MKQGKRPTRREKTMIASVCSDPDNWLVSKRLPRSLHLVHRQTNSIKVIPIT